MPRGDLCHELCPLFHWSEFITLYIRNLSECWRWESCSSPILRAKTLLCLCKSYACSYLVRCQRVVCVHCFNTNKSCTTDKYKPRNYHSQRIPWSPHCRSIGCYRQPISDAPRNWHTGLSAVDILVSRVDFNSSMGSFDHLGWVWVCTYSMSYWAS